MSGKERIAVLIKQISEAQTEINLIQQLLVLYPDLEIENNRFDTKRYISKIINIEVDKYYLVHTDGVLYFQGYKEILNIKIFANPTRIRIGRSYGYKDDHLDIFWEEKLAKHNINPNLIKEMKDNEEKILID